mgnify:CR=1 FL=1
MASRLLALAPLRNTNMTRIKTLDTTRITSQPLLIPASFAATPQEIATAENCAEVLQQLGLEVSALSAKTLAVRAVPTSLAQGDAVELARSVLAELAQHDAATVVQRAQHLGVDMPIAQAVVALLDGDITPAQAVALLMGRGAKGE